MRLRRFGKSLVAVGVAATSAWIGTCAYFGAASPTFEFGAEELAKSPAPWPRGFLWGTATAAHQVEGGNHNDWSRFEEEPGRIAQGERSGLAVDHWNRMAEDVALMTALKANAYRFSIEWSRVEPEEGRSDEAAWARYGELLRLLSEARITPMVTLLHFSLPIWMADRGGVTAPDFPDRFARFAGEAARRFGPEVELWCVLNEPNVQMYLGYVTGTWPPGKKSPAEAVQAAAGLLRAHAKAARAIRAASSRAKVGVAMNLADFQPASRWSLPDWVAARGAATSFDWAFYDSIAAGRVRFDSPGFPRVDEALADLAGSADWFGANYYTRNLVHFSPAEPGMVALRTGTRDQTDLHQEIYPEGLLSLLRTASKRYALPIYVTENGIADGSGDKRGPYIRSHVHAVARAIAEGIPVRGYFYWSLMDNFEWAEGFAPRFGLYRVDYTTLARAPALGSEAFRDLAPVR
jgi:beta-glucosidase